MQSLNVQYYISINKINVKVKDCITCIIKKDKI